MTRKREAKYTGLRGPFSAVLFLYAWFFFLVWKKLLNILLTSMCRDYCKGILSRLSYFSTHGFLSDSEALLQNFSREGCLWYKGNLAAFDLQVNLFPSCIIHLSFRCTGLCWAESDRWPGRRDPQDDEHPSLWRQGQGRVRSQRQEETLRPSRCVPAACRSPPRRHYYSGFYS